MSGGTTVTTRTLRTPGGTVEVPDRLRLVEPLPGLPGTEYALDALDEIGFLFALRGEGGVRLFVGRSRPWRAKGDMPGEASQLAACAASSTRCVKAASCRSTERDLCGNTQRAKHAKHQVRGDGGMSWGSACEQAASS